MDGIYIDSYGNVYLSGYSTSANFPVTFPNTYQTRDGEIEDCVLVILSSDFSHIMFSTYMGGCMHDDGRTSFLGLDGSFYMAGETGSSDFSTKNAYQRSYKGHRDGFVVKFKSNFIIQ